jgi:hypothetical protein
MSLLKKYLSERLKTELQQEGGEGEGGGKVEQTKAVENKEKEKTVKLLPLSINFGNHLKIFDLEEEKLPVYIDQISYVPNAVSLSCGKTIAECVERGEEEWTHLKTRKLKYFGVKCFMFIIKILFTVEKVVFCILP